MKLVCKNIKKNSFKLFYLQLKKKYQKSVIIIIKFFFERFGGEQI